MITLNNLYSHRFRVLKPNYQQQQKGVQKSINFFIFEITKKNRVILHIQCLFNRKIIFNIISQHEKYFFLN